MRLSKRPDLANSDVTPNVNPARPNGVVVSAPWKIREATMTATDRVATYLWLISLVIAAAYCIVFVVQLSGIVTGLAWIGEYASGFTLPETLVRTGTGGKTVIASSGQWVSLWFGLLTAKLPLHRQLWEIAPTLLYIATSLTVGWCVSRIADRRAAILAMLLGLIASPLALLIFMAAVAHNTAYPCTALVGAYLLWLARAARRRRLVAFAVPVLLGIIVGACVASDLLVVVTAVIPLTVAAILAGMQRDRRSRFLALSALTTVAVAIPTARFINEIMHSLGFFTLPTPAVIAPLSALPVRAKYLFKGLQVLFNGYLGGPRAPGTLHTELGIASDVFMSMALFVLLIFGICAISRLIRAALDRSAPERELQLARSLHIVYWVSSAVTACGAFWIAGETGGGTIPHESYYATTIFSVAAVVPLLLLSGSLTSLLAVMGASVYIVASFVGLTGNYTDIAGAIPSYVPTIVEIAQANHVTVGYADFQQASSLTWNTDGRLLVRPLIECQNSPGAEICPFYQASVPSWYVPQKRHTFLLIDNDGIGFHSRPVGLGKPLAAYRLGALRVYVYSYDIASRLGPEPTFSPAHEIGFLQFLSDH